MPSDSSRRRTRASVVWIRRGNAEDGRPALFGAGEAGPPSRTGPRPVPRRGRSRRSACAHLASAAGPGKSRWTGPIGIVSIRRGLVASAIGDDSRHGRTWGHGWLHHDKLRMTPPVPSPGIIDRARLAPLLDGQPVVVLAGMAGYGKSTLLSAAAHRQRDRGAALWLTVDDTDRDPVRLVSDLARPPPAWRASMRSSDRSKQLRGPRPCARSRWPWSTRSSRCSTTARCRSLLALDDLQHLAGSEASTHVIDHVLRWAPANMRIAIAARVVPPLRLQRLRLEDRLDLPRARRAGLQPPRSRPRPSEPPGSTSTGGTVDTIHRATGGWPAGVRMAILAARQSRRPADLTLSCDVTGRSPTTSPPRFSPRCRHDLRDFVLDSCLDEQVCPSLIDTIRGTTTAETYPRAVPRCGALPLPRRRCRERAWYHWHPLFAAHIRRRLATERPSGPLALHASAATWWTPVDAPTAIRHAMAAGDGEMASRIFARAGSSSSSRGASTRCSTRSTSSRTTSAYCSDAHLAKALILVQRGRLDDARAEVDAARASSSSFRRPTGPGSRSARPRRAVPSPATTRASAPPVESGAALLERLDRSGHVPDPAIRASVQVFVGMGEARLQTPSRAAPRDAPLVSRARRTTAGCWPSS